MFKLFLPCVQVTSWSRQFYRTESSGLSVPYVTLWKIWSGKCYQESVFSGKCTLWDKMLNVDRQLYWCQTFYPNTAIGKMSVNASILYKNGERCTETNLWQLILMLIFIVQYVCNFVFTKGGTLLLITFPFRTKMVPYLRQSCRISFRRARLCRGALMSIWRCVPMRKDG